MFRKCSRLATGLQKQMRPSPRHRRGVAVATKTEVERPELDLAESTVASAKPHGGTEQLAKPRLDRSALHRRSVRDASSLMGDEDDLKKPIAEDDTTTAVRFDKKNKTVRLNREQEEAIWNARKEEFSAVQYKIQVALTSHHTEVDKCFHLVSLHDLVMKKHLRLRADTYDEIFHTFQTFVEQQGADLPFINVVWSMYRYMVDSGTDPTPKIHQYLQMILSKFGSPNPEVEAKSHALMMDNDMFKLTPTQYALSSYFQVCGTNNAMHLAVNRYTDSKGRMQIMPTAGMCAVLIEGLTRNGQIDEAMTFISTMGNVPVTDHLLNAVLMAARKSQHPMAAFTLYCSVKGSRLPPSLVTISILTKVCYEVGDFSQMRFILKEMVHHAVKGNAPVLNEVLVGLQYAGEKKLAVSLYHRMRKRGVRVFEERLLWDPSTEPSHQLEQ